MRGRPHGVLLLCLAMAGPARVAAQQADPRRALLTVDVQPSLVTVGEPFTVRVRIRAPRMSTVRFPPVPDSGDAVEAIDPRATEDAGDTVVIDRTAVYRFVAWNVGSHAPRFEPASVTFAGTEQRFPVVVDPIEVRSLLPADSALRVPKEARAPVPSPSGAWRYWLLAFVFGTGAGWYVWRRWRRRRTGGTPTPEAYDAAARGFEALDELSLVECGEPGRHLIAHVDVLRAYLARRFPAARESLTPAELVPALDLAALPELPARVGALLQHEAEVRFARAPIAEQESIALSRESRAIVEELEAFHEAQRKALDAAPRKAQPAGSR